MLPQEGEDLGQTGRVAVGGVDEEGGDAEREGLEGAVAEGLLEAGDDGHVVMAGVALAAFGAGDVTADDHVGWSMAVDEDGTGAGDEGREVFL